MDQRDVDFQLYARNPSLRIADQTVGNQNENRREILQLVPKQGIGVELGVYTGAFSRVLLEDLNPRILHLVDPWWTEFGEYYPDWGSYTDFGKLTTRAAYEAVEARSGASRGSATVCIHIDRAIPWLEGVEDGALDWAYLDTTHKYEATLAELRMISRKVKSTGLILGDDYFTDPDHEHHGVVRAVHAFIREAPYTLIRADKYRQFALRRERSSKAQAIGAE